MKAKKRGIYEKVVNLILDILIIMFGIFLIISIYNNVQIKILGNEYSSFFGYSTFEVQTGSMADAINPGDWIIVKSSKNFKLNDIITYSQNGEFITHRVVEKSQEKYVTKGDANNSKDDPITESQIVGKVVKILPGFGIIRKTFFNPFVLVFLIITLYIVSYILRSLSKNKKRDNNKINYREKVDDLVNFLLAQLIKFIKKHMKDNKKIELEIDDNIENNELEKIDIEEAFEKSDLKIELPEINNEDMDKTLYFRMVSVEKNELDNAHLENKSLKKDDDETKSDNDVENVTLSSVEEKINLIQNKKKKFYNIIEKIIYFKKEEINEIIDILLDGEKYKSNEPSIKEALLKVYIDGKYYNFCGNTNVEFDKRNLLTRMDTEIKKSGEKLISKYKGNDNKYADKVNKYVNLFTLINYLEHKNITTTDLQEKRDLYKNKIIKTLKNENQSSMELKNMINKILKTQKIYQSAINLILEKMSTNTFKLILNKITGKKNMFAVSLEHNILFSKVYSEYIVDKTYTEGIIAEDKVMVLLNLLLVNTVKDMLDIEDNKKYFIHIPNSIYTKPNKLEKIFRLFEDEYAKNNIIIVIEYSDLVKFHKQISKLRKKGYRFSVVFNSETKLNDGDQKFISMAEYLFIDKTIMNYNLISRIPDDLSDSIINDNIINKLSSFGGE